MNAKEMWGAFLQKHPEESDKEYEAWAYGSVPDELAQLTLEGIIGTCFVYCGKRATSESWRLQRDFVERRYCGMCDPYDESSNRFLS